METGMMARYREDRARAVPARLALNWARRAPEALEYGPDGGSRTVGPWRITWGTDYDDGGDPSYYGEVSTDWRPGAIGWETREDDYGRTVASYWFHPARSGQREDYTGSRHVRDLACRRAAREDLQRLRDLWGGQWSYMAATVSVALHGITLGSASCFGIESDSDPEHWDEIYRDLIPDAVEEARATLDTLCTAVDCERSTGEALAELTAGTSKR